MADKKLNEVPVVSDIVTIFGKRSNGEIVQIDKSNLATLLGGLLPDSLGFFKPYTPVSGQDLDQMLNMGFYKIQPLDLSSSNPNLPEGAYSYGSLIVFDNPLDNEKRKVQIYIPNGHAYFYTRVANNGAFYKWNKFNGNEL